MSSTFTGATSSSPSPSTGRLDIQRQVPSAILRQPDRPPSTTPFMGATPGSSTGPSPVSSTGSNRNLTELRLDLRRQMPPGMLRQPDWPPSTMPLIGPSTGSSPGPSTGSSTGSRKRMLPPGGGVQSSPKKQKRQPKLDKLRANLQEQVGKLHGILIDERDLLLKKEFAKEDAEAAYNILLSACKKLLTGTDPSQLHLVRFKGHFADLFESEKTLRGRVHQCVLPC